MPRQPKLRYHTEQNEKRKDRRTEVFMGRRHARRPAQTIKKRRVEYEHRGEES